jgi:dipeptidyl aminopeptidase/acylaminoacyl peptidase
MQQHRGGMSVSAEEAAPRPVVAPYGAWPSSLTPADAAGGAVRVSSVGLALAGDGSTTIRWSEQRPDLNGRIVVCRATVPADGEAPGEGVIEGPAEMSARSGVNEYGGGSWWADGDRLYWTEGLSGGIVTSDTVGGPATQVTTAPPTPRGWRHAAGVLTPPGERRWIVCEREVHPGSEVSSSEGNVAGAVVSALAEPANELAVVPATGGTPSTLVREGDWAVAPALSPDGRSLAWLRWDHPDMPWDAAEVWAARVEYPERDGVPTVIDARRVAGGRAGAEARGLDHPIAACLPAWSPDGRLWWCDDADDWWHLRAADAPGLPPEGAGDRVPVALDVPGEVGEPRWVSGGSRFGFTDDGRVVFALAHDGLDSVQVWDPSAGTVDALPAPPGGFTSVEHLAVLGTVVAVAGGGGAQPTSAWSIDLATGAVVDHRTGCPHSTPMLDAGSVSLPEGISFPTAGGERAHALFYPPRAAGVEAPDGDLPPLVVRIHGGPTASARAEYSTSVQFWTSRGFAVVDVNYRGSTGYGRRYRDLLVGEWGVADVEDCVAAVRWLADEGRVDGGRCVIRGGSAGGFTALEATCRSDVFAAACSLYGVTDLRALAADTHKFESRYLDGLVGPYPQEAARYEERSPLFHAEQLDRPVLLLQGTDDPIVPPSQAEVLREALHAGGIPHALILFPGEAHGFRSASTIVRALEAELAFYGQVLGFTPADDLPPLELQR